MSDINITWNKEQLVAANAKLLEENKALKHGIKRFVDCNFKGGSKADRIDYAVMVTCRDIWELRLLIDEN